MENTLLGGLLRSISEGASRRGILSALTGGVLATLPQPWGAVDTEAKKNGKRKKRKARKKGKRSPLSPPSTGPSTRADATCSSQTTEAIIGDGNVRFAQTFTALTSGLLVRAQLQLNNDPAAAGDFILQLATVDNFGTPTNDVLARTSVANVSVPDGISTVTFSFASPFSVAAGTQYAFVLTRPGALQMQWTVLRGDTCPGAAFTSPNQTAPFALIASDFDFVFTAFISS